MFREDIKLFSGTAEVDIRHGSHDFFNTKESAQPLIDLLKLKDIIKDMKMIALYGEWGSGKTTYIRYVNNVMGSHGYQTVFFEAWKLEFGRDLHLSLLDCIVEELLKNNQKKLTEDVKKAINFCYLFAKNIAFNSSLEMPGVTLGLGEAARATFQEYNDKYRSDSSHSKLKEFKTNYQKVISSLLNKNKTLLIFVDDLDRCEPENVIVLLSAIKHFFTYDDSVKFVCAIDKEAVANAIRIKYGDVIKSTEYLEKIFDFNLTLRKSSDFLPLVNFYCKDGSDNKGFISFLKDMDLVNPRHLVKVLNRVYFLTRILTDVDSKFTIFFDGQNQKSLLKNDYSKNQLFFEMMFFFVAFKEFRPDEYSRLSNLEEKSSELVKLAKPYRLNSSEAIEMFPNILSSSKMKVIHSCLLGNHPTNNGYISADLTLFLSLLYSDKAVVTQQLRVFHDVDTSLASIKYLEGVSGNYSYNFLNYLFYNPNSVLLCNLTTKRFDVIQDVNTDFNIYSLYDFVKNH